MGNTFNRGPGRPHPRRTPGQQQAGLDVPRGRRARPHHPAHAERAVGREASEDFLLKAAEVVKLGNGFPPT